MVNRPRKSGAARAASTEERRGLLLTRRQRQIVELLTEGLGNKAIAERLGVSGQTVKNQLSAIYQKTGVTNRVELVLLAVRTGIKDGS